MERLQRQRVLLQEHLRWLESEIAAEASAPPKAETAAPATPPTPHVDATATPLASGSDPTAPALPEPDIRNIHDEVRSGCLLYFGIASTIIVLAIAYVYWRY